MTMISNMPCYAQMKDSGVEWLGEIPEHWEIKRFKFLASVEKGRLPKKIVSNVDGDYPIYMSMEYLRGGDKTQWVLDKNVKTVNEDEILLLWDGSNSGEFIKSRQGVISSTVAHIQFLGLNKDFGWFFSFLIERQLRGNTIGMGIPHVDGFALTNSIVAIPSLSEQIAIATFLDQKTAQIDQAIALKQKQIELFNERKQLVIQQAVTKGLNPNAPMRDSGVEWIGEIPEHWEVRRSKYVFTQRTERARKNDVQLSATQAYGVIPQDEYESKIGRKVVKIQFHLDKRKHVEIDDFVISMRSFQGGLERAWASGCIRSSYIVLRPLEKINPNYFGHLFKTAKYIKAIQITASFIRDGQDLNFDNFSKVDLFIPPLDEQQKIVDFLDGQIPLIDKAIDIQQQQINKLKEYKATLINSAVTGKIKVF